MLLRVPFAPMEATKYDFYVCISQVILYANYANFFFDYLIIDAIVPPMRGQSGMFLAFQLLL